MKYVLTDCQIKNRQPRAKPYKVADGGGLYVWVSTTGTKAWRFNYRFAGSYKTLALGTYPAVSIKVARDAHSNAIALIVAGNDPAEAKKSEKAQTEGRPTFRQIAAQWQKVIVPTDASQWTWEYRLVAVEWAKRDAAACS